MGNILYIAAAMTIGAGLSIQPPINALMARTLGSPLLAASISIAISLVLVILAWLIWGKGIGELNQVKALPWWIVVGGIVGALFVAGSLMLAPVLGVALLFACVISGQLLGSLLADQLGAFGMQIKPVNTIKLLGLCLVLAGAILVQKSNG